MEKKKISKPQKSPLNLEIKTRDGINVKEEVLREPGQISFKEAMKKLANTKPKKK